MSQRGNASGSRGGTKKKERPREKPVSKWEDLLMHGVKPWDPDADEFYDALVEERRKIDKFNDENPPEIVEPIRNQTPSVLNLPQEQGERDIGNRR